ncbi:MAG TPA: envelope stress response membrane protein PspB [Nevskiaceae bacterium]|nr:envelope stress response membrane protein PspB [Nevskiaceae bacterium]
MEALVGLSAIICIFVVLPGMVLWFADRRRRDRVAESPVANNELVRQAERMEQRIEALEKILDAESPGWRKRHVE